jgi:hypothetical protein
MIPTHLIPLIEWPKFQPGTSFFVPCIDRRQMSFFIRRQAKRIRVQILCKPVIENGVYGLRVWRVDDTVPPHSSPRA